MDPKQYFSKPSTVGQRHYEALRAFFVDQLTAAQAAEDFGYTRYAFYSLVRDFRKTLALGTADPFFPPVKTGRKPMDSSGTLTSLIVSLRKKYLSVPDITAAAAAQGYAVSEKYIYNVITREGFDRLPRRSNQVRGQSGSSIKLEAPKALGLTYAKEHFGSQTSLGVLSLLPYAQHYGILDLIGASSYPESGSLDRRSSILSFVALKLSHVRRYTADDAWCMDRGLGLFAGLTVLPKAAWFSSYSHRVTRKMNLSLLKELHTIYQSHGLLLRYSQPRFYHDPLLGR